MSSRVWEMAHCGGVFLVKIVLLSNKQRLMMAVVAVNGSQWPVITVDSSQGPVITTSQRRQTENLDYRGRVGLPDAGKLYICADTAKRGSC